MEDLSGKGTSVQGGFVKKYLSIIVLSGLLLFQVSASAAGSKIGLGLYLGEPQGGVTLKFGKFPVIGVGWSGLYGNEFRIMVDYWIMNRELQAPIYWYWGVGGKLSLHSDYGFGSFGIGVRVPFGLQWFITDKWELYAETAPGIRIFNPAGFWWDAGLGVRYYF